MRTSIAICLAILLAGIAYWSLQGPGTIDAPPANAEPSSQDPTAVRQVPAIEQSRSERKVTTESADASPIIPTSDAPTEIIPTAPIEQATICVRVRNVVTQATIESFRWRFQHQGKTVRGEAATSTADLPLENLAIGNLLIEADGMQPFNRQDLRVPGVGSPKERIDVFLTPVATAAGITLLVKTLDNLPVENIRVDAFQLTAVNRENLWQLEQPLWARQTNSADGLYTLPPLPPGEYGILLVATNRDGELLPVAPYRHVFALNGSNGYLEDVSLEPACALRIDLQNASGQPFDPKLHRDVSIHLQAAGEEGIERKWTALEDPGSAISAARTVSEANRVPGKGLIWLSEPARPGPYLLEISIDGISRVRQQLQLRPGEQQLEQVIIF